MRTRAKNYSQPPELPKELFTMIIGFALDNDDSNSTNVQDIAYDHDEAVKQHHLHHLKTATNLASVNHTSLRVVTKKLKQQNSLLNETMMVYFDHVTNKLKERNDPAASDDAKMAAGDEIKIMQRIQTAQYKALNMYSSALKRFRRVIKSEALGKLADTEVS